MREHADAESFQKFVTQSFDTAGFHAKNWSMVMKYLSATLRQSSPSTTVCQRIQLLGCPVCVGAPGSFLEVVVLGGTDTVSLGLAVGALGEAMQ